MATEGSTGSVLSQNRGAEYGTPDSSVSVRASYSIIQIIKHMQHFQLHIHFFNSFIVTRCCKVTS